MYDIVISVWNFHVCSIYLIYIESQRFDTILKFYTWIETIVFKCKSKECTISILLFCGDCILYI